MNKNTFWIFVEPEEPKVSDIHMIYDDVKCILHPLKEANVGLIFTLEQYVYFKNKLAELFNSSRSLDHGDEEKFMGFKIRIMEKN